MKIEFTYTSGVFREPDSTTIKIIKENGDALQRNFMFPRFFDESIIDCIFKDIKKEFIIAMEKQGWTKNERPI